MSAAPHTVILIPGFFGFEQLGSLRYFSGVSQALQSAFSERDVKVSVIEAPVPPTGSIRKRAARIVEVIEQVAQANSGPIHLIGHSTGGLDARLAITPTASLGTEVRSEVYSRVSSLITISTPHHGTPLASQFANVFGKPWLRFASLLSVYIFRYGKLPLGVVVKLGDLLTRFDDVLGLDHTVLDELYANFLRDFTSERQDALVDYLQEVSSDQSLVFQLTHAGVDLFNATTADPSHLRYGSVVTLAPAPSVRGVIEHGFDVYSRSMYFVFALLYKLTQRVAPHHVPEISKAQEQALRASLGALPELGCNDGIVPALSQVWGEVIDVASCDHLDVVGHYASSRESEHGRKADWLPSTRAFDDAAFDRLWAKVAAFLLAQPAAREGAGSSTPHAERSSQDPSYDGVVIH